MNDFVAEEIEVIFIDGFHLEKKPPCPDAIIWRGDEIRIVELMSSWSDFNRKGTSTKNMREKHLSRAKTKGSWGVGKFYFKVKDYLGRILTLYYDRSPRNAFDRKGKWFLFTIAGEKPLEKK